VVKKFPIKNQKSKIKDVLAVFGGTFDPPHNGHMRIAGKVLDSGRADKVVFVPAFHPPHKPDSPVTSFAGRLEMLRLAVPPDPRFEISDIEGRRSGPSYTFDTLMELGKMNKGSEIRLLMGSDSLAQFHTWYRAAEIVQIWTLIVYPRKGYLPSKDELKANWGPEVAERLLGYILPMPCLEVSSTEIRKRIIEGRDLDGLVCSSVGRYIVEKKIYR